MELLTPEKHLSVVAGLRFFFTKAVIESVILITFITSSTLKANICNSYFGHAATKEKSSVASTLQLHFSTSPFRLKVNHIPSLFFQLIAGL